MKLPRFRGVFVSLRAYGSAGLFWDSQGLACSPSAWSAGGFVWPQAKDCMVTLTPAQLSMLLEGIDWRMPARTWQPEMAG